MRYDLVIFDLDGTLLNTLEDLADATNIALGEEGFPPRTEDEVRRFVGNGVRNLMRRALPEEAADDASVERVLTRFREHYSRNIDVKTHAYPGVHDMLEALRARGVHTAVNSNKYDGASKILIASHFGELIECTLGEREGVPKKPAPDGANLLMAHFGVDRSRTLYVGDSDTDVMTAANAGIDSAWVSWGFRAREELADAPIKLRFDSVPALKEYLLD